MPALNTLLATSLPALLGFRGRQRLAILNYHRVLPGPDPMRPGEPDPETFRWQMQLLADHFNPLPLAEAVERLAAGSLPARAVCVTFDDGYADNAEIAAPLLRALGIPATVFVATGFIGGGLMWNDAIIEFARIADPGSYRAGAFDFALPAGADGASRRKAAGNLIRAIKHLPATERQDVVDGLTGCRTGLPQDLMMSETQLRGLSAQGLQVGAHTVSHPILASIDDELATQEIVESKSVLETLTGQTVSLFAYPNGKPGADYLPRHREMVARTGFAAAVSTEWGVADPSSDSYQLPRFTPWDKTPTRFLLRLLLNYRQVAGTPSSGP